MIRSTIRPLVLATMATFTLLAARPATAQVGDADLVRENERLTAEVQDLQAALEAALARIAELEAALAASGRGSGAGSTAAPASTPGSKVAAKAPPEASQEGAIAAIRAAFAAAVESGEIAPQASPRDESARIRHLRSLQKWVASAARAYKAPIEWPVLVLASEVVSSTDGRLRVQVWDPKNATTVGEPFDLPVARRVVERVNRPRPLDAAEPAVFVLDGVFTPSLRVNERRTEVGAFDNPRFVGPMVELSWFVDAKSVGPWSAPEATAVAEDTD